ncbi:N-acetylglucosamine kinase [Streptomyces daghestanicus]|uniref:N-acetylglucosamine kinase n=1 Tax=Streptomyces daghestanicus TaxID=66885 RepID=UPI00167DC5B0|nr:BadF/BadG/BcrA/BcrD ATPase family protein [Streptomyces daghestanicus]
MTDGHLAVDSGGSGLRVAVGAAGGGAPARRATREPVRTGARGIDPGHLLEHLLPMARAAAAEAGVARLTTAVVGAAGLATLGEALRAELPGALARELGTRTLALAADAVTAYVGALGFRAGAVVAAGTGAIAVGTDLTRWRRADGWGHLLGDCGSGAWIGRAGLEAALRAHDGREDGSAALLARATRRFGPAPGLPGALYPRTDRAAVLASFAPDVAACAAGDPVAADILRAAARHLAGSAAAVCPEGASVALTGGLRGLGDPLLVPLEEELARRLPGVRRVPAEGGPLDGAVRLAAGLATGPLPLPDDPGMLWVTVAEGG